MECVKLSSVIDPPQVVFHSDRALRDPVVILAYAGWNDAGEAATDAARFLLDVLPAEKLATLEYEEFLDYTVTRPHLQVGRDGAREVLWPAQEFFSIHRPRQPFDLVIGVGVEPHLQWRAHCRAVSDLLTKLGVRTVLLLGAYPDEVIYSQPVPVFGFASDPELGARAGIPAAPMEGPTGIVGVLGDTLGRGGLRVLALFARLPHYVSRMPHVRGTLALLRRVESATGLWLGLDSLEREAAEFDHEVSEMIATDPQLAAYVRELKRRAFQT